MANKLNRRHLLGGASLAAAAVAIPAQASTPLWAPTERGRKLLRLIARVQVETRKVAVCAAEEEDALLEVQSDAMAAVDVFGMKIIEEAAKTPGDIVDRAIFACWRCHPFNGALISRNDDYTGGQEAFIEDVLALAGISLEACRPEGDLVREVA
jgi:hypothetical protein